jgi:hypothetical protein
MERAAQAIAVDRAARQVGAEVQAVGARDASDAVGPAVHGDLAAEELPAHDLALREVRGPADRKPGLRVEPALALRRHAIAHPDATLGAAPRMYDLCRSLAHVATSCIDPPAAPSPRQPGPPARGGRSRRRAREPRAARRHRDRRTRPPWPRAPRCAATASRPRRAPATSCPLAAPRTRGRTARAELRDDERAARLRQLLDERQAHVPAAARRGRIEPWEHEPVAESTGVRHRAPPCPRARPRSARRRRARRAPSAGRRRRRGSRCRNECATASARVRSTTPARVRHRRVRPRVCTAHGSPRPATRGHRASRRSCRETRRRPLAPGRPSPPGTSSECTSA